MLEEDGNPTLECFKKTYRDDDKYMSNLVKCERIILFRARTHTHVYYIDSCEYIVHLYL